MSTAETPETPALQPPAGGLEKWAPHLETPAQVREALELAFDYRGDVTLTARDGRQHVGYVFNRVNEGVAEPYLEYLPKDGGGPVRILYKDVTGVAFTGVDAAAGRSWEAWTARVAEKQKALREGRDIGDIEPKPPELDRE